MTEKLELYRCEICGNLVEVIITGNGDLVCCGEPMNLLTANTEEAMKGEFHLPIKHITPEGDEIIQVGEKPHPMTEEHYIQFIQAISEDGQSILLKFLKPNMEPNMSLEFNAGDYIAREYCNIHGLWASIIKHE